MDSPNSTATTVFGKTNRTGVLIQCCFIRTFEKLFFGILYCSQNLVLRGSVSSVNFPNCNLTFKVSFPGSGTVKVVKFDKYETLHIFVCQKETDKANNNFTLKCTEIHPTIETHCCGFGDRQMLSCDFPCAFSVACSTY